MKGFLKKVYQKTAVVLTASMLATSIMPMTGLAKEFDVGGVYDEVDWSDYLATASVAATVTGDNGIQLASGSNGDEVTLTAKYDIDVKAVSLATGSTITASESDWRETVEEVIASKLKMTATISDADSEIAAYISEFDTAGLDSKGEVTVGVNIPNKDIETLAGGTYAIDVAFLPKLPEDLGDGIVIDIKKDPYVFTIRVTVEGEGELKSADIRLKDFHDEGKTTTWTYMEDGNINLNEFCETDPEGLKVVFESSEPEVATVSDAGIFMPLANGETTITAWIAEEGYEEEKAELKVQVWNGELMTGLPDAFVLYEGDERTFDLPKGVSSTHTCVLDRNGNEVNKTDAEIIVPENDRKHPVLKAKKAGEYQLRFIRHMDDERITYYGYVDFTVKPLQSTTFKIHGFNENDKPNADGIMTTWTYNEYGPVYLPNYCETSVEGATFTFTSSDEAVATINGDILEPVDIGKTTITATMTAPGYQPVTDTLIVQVWGSEEQRNLPDELTLYEGESKTYRFAEPLHERTDIKVLDMDDEEKGVGKDVVAVSVSEDRMSITVEAKQAGNYLLRSIRHNEEKYTTYFEYMEITVLRAGISLELSTNQVVVEPYESVTFDVAYSPADAKISLEYDSYFFEATNENGKITVTGLVPNDDWSYLKVELFGADGKFLLRTRIPVYVVEKQLEAMTVEEALAEATEKLAEGWLDRPVVYKIVAEVVAVLEAAPQADVIANKDAIDELEAKLTRYVILDDEIFSEAAEIETTGALLNLLVKGEAEGKLIVERVSDTTNSSGVTLDIKLVQGSDGESITDLAVPMQIRIKVPGIDLTKKIRIKHTKEDGSVEWIYPAVSGEYIVFWVDSFSEFAISNYTTSSGGSSGGGGGGGSSTSTSVSGTVSSDARKGYVNSITGIITGSAAGYSQWNQDENGWKLRYADGTFAAGFMGTDANGNAYEQVAWEMVNGAWYPFGANGYVKSGLVYDVALAGTFYVDINTGMKTGWQQVDGVWHYFNTVSDGKRGIMLTNTTIDGYYIDAEGVWKE